MLLYYNINEISLYTTIGTKGIKVTREGMRRKMKRTDFEVCKSIFEALIQNNPIHKSDLRELTGLGPKSVNKWVDLIGFIQSQPKLKITKSSRYQILELATPPPDEKVYPETIEALKLMRSLLVLPPDELKKKLEELG